MMRCQSFRACFLSLVFLLLAAGCTDLTEGMTAGDCTDGVDNDGDGAFDCLDSDCAGSPDCAGDDDDTVDDDDDSSVGDDDSSVGDDDSSVGDDDSSVGDDDSSVGDDDTGDDDDSAIPLDPETSFQCADNIDNDLDGDTDCADSGCATWFQCVEAGANCFDTVDNDLDGQTDCADTDCAGTPFCIENCADNFDNDADGQTDCADTDCVGTPYCIEVCDDVGGVDEDLDGFANCLDTECDGIHPACGGGGVAEICDNNVSDNGNALIDCYDPECVANPNCLEDSGSNCTDTVDNDLDGATDCADTDCATQGPCLESQNCTDGIDNDLDGDIDCFDPDCSGSSISCFELAGLNCDDNQDNDNDGQTDCADPGCANDANCTTTSEDCTNGIDDNSNNLIDCADSDCEGVHLSCIESTGFNCGDNVDNDLDGQTDCDDLACATDPLCFESICFDNVDNDGDNLVDCLDLDCVGSVSCPETQNCSDGIDNDGDLDIDCDDSDCSNVLVSGVDICPETCDDGVDNDADNLNNCDDPECSETTFCIEICDNVDANNAPIDDDANGLANCDDPDCLTSSLCTPEICTDAAGADEDGDGYANCADSDCWVLLEGVGPDLIANTGDECVENCSSVDTNNDGIPDDEDNDGGANCGDSDCSNVFVAGVDICPEDCSDPTGDVDNDGLAGCADEECINGASASCVENTHALCTDGSVLNPTDNDGDGAANCLDTDCLAITIPGTSTLLCVPEDCTNGSDDNGDQFTDCDDPQCWVAGGSCSEDPSTTLSATHPTDAGLSTCADSGDNDGDGLPDCLDPDCSDAPNCPENCTNGLDDDADGNIDCADDECDTDSACIDEICDNNIDDDGDCPPGTDTNGDQTFCGVGDLNVDCLDAECSNGLSPSCVENTLALCTGGEDEDGDGDVDCADSDCGGVVDGTGVPLCGEVLCFDGTDDDNDGTADCGGVVVNGVTLPADPDCCTDCGTCQNEDCAPGLWEIDEDNSGDADCDDSACSPFAFCSSSWPGIVTTDSSTMSPVNASGECIIPANGDVTCTLDVGEPDFPNLGAVTEFFIANPLGVRGAQIEINISYGDDGTGGGLAYGVEDLDISLVDCNGVDLSVNAGGLGVNFTSTIFDNNAAETIFDAGPGPAPWSDSYLPETNINCGGYEVNGVWSLYVDNLAGNFAGTITDWSITFDLGEVDCDDGEDNNSNGDTDCADADCNGSSGYTAHPLCGGGTGNPEICGSQGDEDQNGFADCADIVCDTDTGPSGELCQYGLEQECSDGHDNDADGSIDCADTDCSCADEATDNGAFTCDDSDMFSTPSSCPRCTNGVDDDGNGQADCGGLIDPGPDGTPNTADDITLPADASCTAAQGVCTGGGTCDGTLSFEYDSNGVGCNDTCDGDGDGLHNCDDVDDCCSESHCENLAVCLPPAGENCSNGIDDDGDFLVDCDDGQDCANDPACGDEAQSCVAGATTCPECGDCTQPGGSATDIQLCDSTYTIPYDNDGDGVANCDDLDCAILQECQTSEGHGIIPAGCHDPNPAACPECYNGLDDDNDGDGVSNVPNHTGALDNSGNWNANAPIQDGADCYDPESVACYNDSTNCSLVAILSFQVPFNCYFMRNMAPARPGTCSDGTSINAADCQSASGTWTYDTTYECTYP
jgi:hypothetical protein